jgi:amidase
LLLLYGECGAADVSQSLHELTIAQLQTAMTDGGLSSRQLVEHCLARIEAIDRNGPRLNSVIEVNPEALAIADQLDAERHDKGARGPLHGIPILLKDNIDTADAMLTTAGSLALMNSRPASDAFIVTRLRNAGAVILGKTNLSEWANFRSSRSSSGWSARGGQTRNPYAIDRNPCGSSSGSAAAVAAGLTVVAVGTETDGSIVCPAAINGIVGIKPTIGLVSRSGIIPISASQDTAGPMARTVSDAVILLKVLAGADPADSATTASTTGPLPDYLAELKADGLKGARIGVARNFAGFHEGVDAIFDQAIAKLAEAGAVIVDPANLQLDKKLSEDEMTVLLYEFKDGLNRYLGARPGEPDTLAELIDFNEREHEREMPYFRQEIFLDAQKKGPLTEREYRRASQRARKAAGHDGIDALLEKYRLDAIIAPTVGPAWVTDIINGDHFVGGEISAAPAVAGYPHVTVPAGFLLGLPIGISFVGAAWSEPTLIRLAFAFEQVTHAHRPPDLP